MGNKQFALTTFDNPYDPFKQFDEWFAYDTQNGYNSCGVLARIVNYTDDMTSLEELAETERAIDLIVMNDFTNTFKKVVNELQVDDAE